MKPSGAIVTTKRKTTVKRPISAKRREQNRLAQRRWYARKKAAREAKMSESLEAD
jgi:hypothetical protein